MASPFHIPTGAINTLLQGGPHMAKNQQDIDSVTDEEISLMEDAVLDRSEDEYYFGMVTLYEKGIIQPEDL